MISNTNCCWLLPVAVVQPQMAAVGHLSGFVFNGLVVAEMGVKYQCCDLLCVLQSVTGHCTVTSHNTALQLP